MSFGNRARPPEEGRDHGQAVRRALPGGWSRAARRASGHPAQGVGGRRRGEGGGRCQRWAAPGAARSGTAGGSAAARRTVTGSANNSCGAIVMFGQRGKGHCSQIGLFNNTCMLR